MPDDLSGVLTAFLMRHPGMPQDHLTRRCALAFLHPAACAPGVAVSASGPIPASSFNESGVAVIATASEAEQSKVKSQMPLLDCRGGEAASQ